MMPPRSNTVAIGRQLETIVETLLKDLDAADNHPDGNGADPSLEWLLDLEDEDEE